MARLSTVSEESVSQDVRVVCDRVKTKFGKLLEPVSIAAHNPEILKPPSFQSLTALPQKTWVQNRAPEFASRAKEHSLLKFLQGINAKDRTYGRDCYTPWRTGCRQVCGLLSEWGAGAPEWKTFSAQTSAIKTRAMSEDVIESPARNRS